MFLLYIQRFIFIFITLVNVLAWRRYFLTEVGIEDLCKYIEQSPFFIKIAQWLSTREDVFNANIRTRLAKFQSFAPTDDIVYVWKVLKSDPDFSAVTNISEAPIASGSIAQVHTCTYEGKKCALKVIHENANVLLIDLNITIRILNILSIFVSTLRSIKYNDILNELGNQVNFKCEFNNYISVKKNFIGAPNIYIPDVYIANEEMIVIEFYEGIRFSELTDEERFMQKKKMISCLYKMVICDRLCHGDFHPGNFLFKRKGETNVDVEMCILDFGVTHQVSKENSKGLLYMYKSFKTQKDEDYYIFYQNSIDNLPSDLSPLVTYHKLAIDRIQKTRIKGKGITNDVIKSCFNTAKQFKLMFNGILFNLMLQIMILHQHMDNDTKQQSVFLESFKYMMNSPYYANKMGYKIKMLSETMTLMGYE